MLVSFTLNSQIVFPSNVSTVPCLVRFVGVNCVSAYILQSVILSLMLGISVKLAMLGTGNESRAYAIGKNVAKASAVGVGLVWNFFLYKFFVFNV